jgi:nucleoside 2-deoxyribosyltransferase
MRKVFISYSMTDAGSARQLIAALRDIQATGFMDQADLEGGQPIAETIRDAIRSADAVVVLMSPTPSYGVLFELGVAQAMGKKVISVLLPGTKFEGTIPEVLKDTHIVDARNAPITDVVEKIKSIT